MQAFQTGNIKFSSKMVKSIQFPSQIFNRANLKSRALKLQPQGFHITAHRRHFFTFQIQRLKPKHSNKGQPDSVPFPLNSLWYIKGLDNFMNCYNLKSLFMFLFYCVKNFLIRLQQKKLYCKKFSELGLLRRILFSYWLLQFF